MRSAVFITPETLLQPSHADHASDVSPGFERFLLTRPVVSAIRRLKQAGFLIIGLGQPAGFHGFASRESCHRFLSDSALDDVIIAPAEPCSGTGLVQAAAKWMLDLDQCYFIGHGENELADALAAGCTTFRMSESLEASSPSGAWTGLVDDILRFAAAAAPGVTAVD